MDPNQKKIVLRMIPYGLFVLTAEASDGRTSAVTVNWVTQASFEPPLVGVGVRKESFIYQVIQAAGHFGLNILGKGQQNLAFTFFKPAERLGMTLSGEPFHTGLSGAPIFETVPAYLDCQLRNVIELGDHSIMVGEVIDAGVNIKLEGRPDDGILWLKDLGEKIFYGG